MPRVGIVQMNVAEGPEGLLAHVGQTLAGQEPALWVLPELAAGGFDYPRCEELAARTPFLLERLSAFCAREGHALLGTFWDLREGRFHNSLYLVSPDGWPRRVYAKAHLFPGADEERHFAPGQAAPEPFAWQGLRIGAAVCFDLRFPELFRLQAARGVDLFAIPAQWPAARAGHWSALLTARAIENQCFVLGANACGHSPFGPLAGQSRLVSPWGDPVLALDASPCALAADLDPGALAEARRLYDSRTSPLLEVRLRKG